MLSLYLRNEWGGGGGLILAFDLLVSTGIIIKIDIK